MTHALALRPASRNLLPLAVLSLAVFAATGCSIHQTAPISSTPVAENQPIEGRVYAGEQPLVGASIQLYAAGTPASGGGNGLGATALITGTLPTTNSTGNFSITGHYTAPTAASHFYIVATGGSPGSGNPVNPNITLMAAIGGCTATNGLSSSIFTNINEVTTIATILALQPFMAAPVAGNVNTPLIGASSTSANSLANAFETVNNLVNTSTGVIVTPSQNYAATTGNGLTINTLADILVHCVNSDPSSTGFCSTLFADATPSGAAYVATDTAQAGWYIAQNPTNDVPALFGLVPGSPPFAGLLTAPSNYAISTATEGGVCQTLVPLASAGNYAILAGTTVTNASTNSDQTVITGGDVGVNPGTATTGFVTGTYTATLDNTDAGAAEGDLTAAYKTAAGLLLPQVLPGDMSNLTFTPGLYNTASAVTLNSGAVTLDAQGDPNAVFVFQIGTTLIVAGGTQVTLVNGASARNVFWQVGSSATIGTSAAYAGNIIAYTSITLDTDATLLGRALASNGQVSMQSNKVTVP